VRIEPFSINVEGEVLEDLRVRLERTRWPGAAPGEPWAQGAELSYVQRLVAHWRDGYDWRRAERELNGYPQFVADVDGVRVHFVHVRRGGVPLVLTHGWPSAFTEGLGLVERLPQFDLVIPSLPGYAFSSRPDVCTTRDVAGLWHTLMQGLGYERYGAGGGDWGAAVATYMALQAPERMVGIHLSGLDNAPPPTEPLTAAEREYLAASDHWDATQRGYSTIQSTQPQTLAYGLTDSPAGLAAWIAETRIAVRTGIANFHHNRVSEGVLPREWAERLYNVERFTDMPRGGHFAAAEAPDLLAAEITAFFGG
jgi:pimeloyl-ACP methyl ester carboxylesterase